MRRIFIIIYHRINDSDNSYLPPTKVKCFEKQMRYLSKNYDPVSLEQITQHIQYGAFLPRRPIAVTFDDGYRDNYENAYPILRKYNIPATIFLTVGYIDTDKIPFWDRSYYVLSNIKKKRIVSLLAPDNIRYEAPLEESTVRKITRILNRFSAEERDHILDELTSEIDVDVDRHNNRRLMLSWEEIREMSNNGISFGGHTLTHPPLTRISKGQAEKEIRLCKTIIQEQTKKPVKTFAYPVGDFDTHIAEMVRDAGYSIAVSTVDGYSDLKTNRYRLRRNTIGLPLGFSRHFMQPVFRAEVSGLTAKLRKHYHRVCRLKARSTSDYVELK